ncbi:MAG: PilZ domain-containing protein [Methylobacterium sp.]
MPGEALIRFAGIPVAPDAGIPPGDASTLRERRSEPRTPTNWIAMILLADGTEIPCTVKDVSKSGARLGLPDTIGLPEVFSLKVLGYAFLFRVRLVWRSGHCAGVRIERFAKAPPPAPAPEEPKAPVEPREGHTPLRRRISRFSKF